MSEECLTPVGKECFHDGAIGQYGKLDGKFQAGDWVVLGCVLGVSLCIGLIFGWIDRNKTTEEYMMGDKNTSPIPISFSLGATFFSGMNHTQ